MQPKHITEALKRDAITFAREYGKAFASKAQQLLTEKAKTAMEDFYGDYTPSFYYRTDNLLENSYKKIYKNSHGRSFSGGVQLSASFMDEYYTGFGIGNEIKAKEGIKEAVFETAWMSGYHGIEPVKISNPPYDALYKYYASEEFKTAINDAGIKAAKNGSYILKYSF